MKEIDFIPEWYKANRNRRKRYHRQYLMLGCLLVGMMAWSFVVGRHVEQVRADVEDIQSVFEKGNLKVTQGLALEADIADLQQQIDLVESVSPRTDITPILAELSWLMGDNMVLTRLSLTSEAVDLNKSAAAGGQTGLIQFKNAGSADESKSKPDRTRTKVTLTGLATEGADAAALISRLEESAWFEQVLPVYTRAKQINHSDITEFEIRCYVADYRIEEVK